MGIRKGAEPMSRGLTILILALVGNMILLICLNIEADGRIAELERELAELDGREVATVKEYRMTARKGCE